MPDSDKKKEIVDVSDFVSKGIKKKKKIKDVSDEIEKALYEHK